MESSARKSAIDRIRRKRLSSTRRRRTGHVVADDHHPSSAERDPSRHHYCYALELVGDDDRGGSRPRRTYVGYTVDPARRLRQHNGELAGGARATSRGLGKWRFLFVVAVEEGACRFGAHEGLSLEWHLKRGRGGGGKKGSRRRRTQTDPVSNRVSLLREALSLQKFCAFRDRVVVFASERCIDSVWAELLDLPFEVCVLDLESNPPNGL